MGNARAARRRAKKETKDSPTIQLSNPVANHFASFIVGNAQHCDRVVEEGSAAGQHLVLCGAGPSLAEHAAEWCPQGDQVWGCNSAASWLQRQGHRVTHAFTVDQTAHMVAEWYEVMPVEYLVASSVHPHLVEHLLSKGASLRFFHNFVGLQGRPVLYGVCRRCQTVMDDAFAQPEGCHETAKAALQERTAAFVAQWAEARRYSEKEYGAFREWAAGQEIELGLMPYEDWLYSALYAPTIRCGSGLNSVNRAIDLALYVGFARITLLGADCCLRMTIPPPADAAAGSPERNQWLRDHTIMHADGGHALASGATATTLGLDLEGRYWETKPDMAISAEWLVRAKHQLGDRLQLIGDTLPNFLVGRDEAFLKRLPKMIDSRGRDIAINLQNDPVYARV